jgi:hypothetical protein
MAPAKFMNFYVRFHDKSEKLSINLTVRHDAPLSPEDSLWTGGIFASELNQPADLTLETIPFLPPAVKARRHGIVRGN